MATPRRPREVKVEYLRLKEASKVFSIGETKIKEIATSCDALISMPGIVLIDYEKFKDYIESFKL